MPAAQQSASYPCRTLVQVLPCAFPGTYVAASCHWAPCALSAVRHLPWTPSLTCQSGCHHRTHARTTAHIATHSRRLPSSLSCTLKEAPVHSHSREQMPTLLRAAVHLQPDTWRCFRRHSQWWSARDSSQASEAAGVGCQGRTISWLRAPPRPCLALLDNLPSRCHLAPSRQAPPVPCALLRTQQAPAYARASQVHSRVKQPSSQPALTVPPQKQTSSYVRACRANLCSMNGPLTVPPASPTSVYMPACLARVHSIPAPVA
jgi:hypothetical protein